MLINRLSLAVCCTFVPSNEKTMLTENQISNKIIGLALDVHTALGPGLLESVYKECLYYELLHSGLKVEKEKPVPLVYKDVKFECGFRVDILVEEKLVIEIKSIEALNFVHLAQTLTYLRLGNYTLGLLINFNVYRLKEGLRRVINGTL